MNISPVSALKLNTQITALNKNVIYKNMKSDTVSFSSNYSKSVKRINDAVDMGFEIYFNSIKKQGFNSMIIYCLKDNPTTEFYKHMGGELVLSKERNIGGKDLIENVYYYDSI